MNIFDSDYKKSKIILVAETIAGIAIAIVLASTFRQSLKKEKAATFPSENTLWLEADENLKKLGGEALLTVGEDANERDPVFRFMMNKRLAQCAAFYCSVLPLNGATHHENAAIPSELEVKLWKRDYKELTSDAFSQKIESDAFHVESTRKEDNRYFICVIPLNPGTDILEISSPECAFTRKILLMAEERE